MDLLNNLRQFMTPSYIKVGAIIILLFLLIVSFAVLRKHFVKWSMKGGLIGLFFGFLLAIILEGFLIISGKTAIIGLLGWKNAPKPIQIALDRGKNELIGVLGVATKSTDTNNALEILQNLNPDEIKKIKAIMCIQ